MTEALKILLMHEIEGFFAEQDRRMNIPDEDVDQYIQTRLAASRKNQSTQRYGPEELSGFRVDRPQSLDPGSRLSRQGIFGAAQHASTITQECEGSSGLGAVRKNKIAETGAVGMEENVSFRIFPELFCTKHSVAHPAKRRKILLGEHNFRDSADRSLATSVSDGLVPHPNFDTSHRNSMSGFAGPAPRNERDSITPAGQAGMVQAIDLAMPLSIERSIYGNTPSCRTEAQALRQKSNTPPISAPDNSPVRGMLSLSPISSRRNTGTHRSTLSDGHGKNSFEFPDRFPHLSPANGAAAVDPQAVAPATPLSRPSGVAHEPDCIDGNSIPRTPKGINAAVSPDFSNITSPGDTLSGQAIQEAQPSLSTSRYAPKETKIRKTVNSRRARKVSGSAGSNKRAKDQPKLVTPLEYAQKLQSCLNLHVSPKTNYLMGRRIFYVGADMTYASSITRGRMDYIVKHGGTLVPKYDSTLVTHIVTDAGVRKTLQALSLKSLSDIPNDIPTVTWSWVISRSERARKRKSKVSSLEDNQGGDDDNALDYEFMYAAFPERIDAGRNWKNIHRNKQSGKTAAHDRALRTDDHSGDVSRISTFSQEGESAPTESLTVSPPPPLEFRSVESHKPDGHTSSEKGERCSGNEDPLAEYYAQARADREARWDRDASDSDEGDSDPDYPRILAPRRGFICDVKGYKPTECVNQHIVDKLEELRELHRAKSSEDDRWRAYSYGKCIPALRNYPKPIKTLNEARSIRGVGEKTALKIMEIVNTGDLRRIKYENTDDVAVTRLFQGIYGVGRNTAFAWYASGLRTLDDVRARKGGIKLSLAQEIGLKFYDDINSRMPREEAKRIFEMIKPIALAIDDKLFIEIMGSYRRGKADCGDIDIMITRPTTDGKTHQGVLRTLLDRLHTVGIITEDLAVPDDFSDLELIYRGLCTLTGSSAKRRRIDFLCVPWENRGAALLYYTGDDIFNRAMRLKARKHGYSLNQRGLYAGAIRDPHDVQKKICKGRIIASETEEEIFKILGVPWQEPRERVRG